MRNRIVGALICLVLGSLVWAGAVNAGSRLGVGVTYWHALEDVELTNLDFDRDGVSWFLSYQSRGAYLVGWEAGLEMMPEGFMASTENVYGPQAYVIVGSSIYGAAGIGWYYSDGDWADEPFYALRVGMEYTLVPSIYFDIYANYRFTRWGDLKDEEEDIDTDTIMLGAAVRLGF